MINRIVIPAKRSNAVIPVVFYFGTQMEFGETIEAVAINVVVSSGTDPNPNAIVSGPAAIEDQTVTQSFGAGTVGVIYYITMLATTNFSHAYTLGGYLSIVNNPEAFNAGF